MGRWVHFNPNPAGKSVGDCAVRAIVKATDQNWETVYMHLTVEGFRMHDLISANSVWGSYLRRCGYTRDLVQDDCDRCSTVDAFAREHPEGTFILALSGHVVCVQHGCYYDSWDSGHETPIYYWHKEE